MDEISIPSGLSRRGLLAGAAALSLALAGCGTGGGDANTGGGATGGTGAGGAGGAGATDPNATLRWATSYLCATFDPHKTRVPSDGIGLLYVYDRLLHREPDGKPKPGLAESWTISDDLKSLTFKIRPGLKFADGTPLDAKAVVANIQRAKEPDSITAGLLRSVVSVAASDDSTVVCTTDGAPAALPGTFTDLAGMIVNPAAFATPEKAKGLITTPDGVGRFRFTKAQPNAHYEFTATPDYWDKEAVPVKGLVIEIMADPQTRFNALQGGQVDIAFEAPSTIAPARSAGHNVDVVTNVNIYGMRINQTKPVFARKETRQALLHALERKPIIDAALEGFGAPANQFFPAGQPGHDPAAENVYPFDLDKAKSLIGGTPVTFNMLVLAFPEILQMAEVLKQQWARIGVTVNIVGKAPADVTASYVRGEGDAVLGVQTYQADNANMLGAVLNPGGANPNKNPVPGLPEALAAANKETDAAKRATALQKAARTVLDDAAYLPVSFIQHGQITTKKVVGYKPSPTLDELRGVGLAK